MIRNFEKRWKRKLSRRKFGCLSVKRSASLHPEIIDPFFEMYRSHLEGVPPDRIYNCDETGIKTDGVKKRRCYSGKGAKSCYSKQPSEGKLQYTVMFTIYTQALNPLLSLQLYLSVLFINHFWCFKTAQIYFCY